MNPHYHPYGAAELTSPPHPPSPDNNNYHGHPGPGGPPPNHSRMMATNGHGIGPLGRHTFHILQNYVAVYKLSPAVGLHHFSINHFACWQLSTVS